MGGSDDKTMALLMSNELRSFFDFVANWCKGRGALILFLKTKEEPVKVSDIAKRFDVSMPRISSLLHSLEKEGLIKRTKRKMDLRSTYVRLSPSGEAKGDEILQEIEMECKLINEDVGEETVIELLNDARKIGESVKRLQKEGKICCR